MARSTETSATSAPARAAELRELLGTTTLPASLVQHLVDGAPAVWLATNAPAVLAGDLVLTHPPLGDQEVRARADALVSGDAWRLAVVARDRAGLLADTAAALAVNGFCIGSAGAATWPALDLALHTLRIEGPMPDESTWQSLGQELRRIEGPDRPAVVFRPEGTAFVECTTDEAGRWLLQVRAPDQVGLLSRICRQLAEQGLGILAADIGGADGNADGLLVLDGEPNVADLTRAISVDTPAATEARPHGA